MEPKTRGLKRPSVGRLPLRPFQQVGFVMQAVVLASLGCSLSGCLVAIHQPQKGKAVGIPVAANATWGQWVNSGSFKAILDGQDQTSEFTIDSAHNQATASLCLSPGPHVLVISGDAYFLGKNLGPSTDTSRFTANASFTLLETPNSVALAPQGTAIISISANIGCRISVPITVSFSGLPPGVTASPANPVITNAPVTVELSASATIGSGTSNVMVTGNGGGGMAQTSFTLSLSGFPPPSISSIAPPSQARGSNVTVSGNNFSSVCANNIITVGGVTVAPTPPCSSTTLNFVVPFSAVAGLTTVQVASSGRLSNAVNFTVLRTEVVVAGTPNGSNFAVIDFSNPNNPHVVNPSPGFSGGTAVDCSGSKVAVGNLNGGQVVLYDISNPASPARLSAVTTVLGGIGAIKFDGSRILLGEMNGFRVVLIDASNANAPTIISTFTTAIGGIGSVGMSGNRAVVSGPNNATMEIIDYTNPTQPTGTLFNPNTGSSLTVDLDGTLAATGANTSSQAVLVDISTPAVVSTAQTPLGGITSVSVSGSLVAAASANSFNPVLIDFTNRSSPTVTPVSANLGGGWTVVLNRTRDRLAAGNVNGFNVVLWGLSGTTAGLLANVPSGIGSIGTICVSDF